MGHQVAPMSLAKADDAVAAIEFDDGPEGIGSVEAIRAAKGRVGDGDRVDAKFSDAKARRSCFGRQERIV